MHKRLSGAATACSLNAAWHAVSMRDAALPCTPGTKNDITIQTEEMKLEKCARTWSTERQNDVVTPPPFVTWIVSM